MKLTGFYNYTEKERALKDLEAEQKDKESLMAWYAIQKEYGLLRGEE